MTYFLQQSLNTLQLGSIYALIALGYTMVYGILTMINFAHGDLFMVGAFFCFITASVLKLPFVPTMLISMIGVALLGVVIERVAYRPLRQAPRVSAVITALAVGILLESVMLVIFPYPQSVPHPSAGDLLDDRRGDGFVAADHHHLAFVRSDAAAGLHCAADDGWDGDAGDLMG